MTYTAKHRAPSRRTWPARAVAITAAVLVLAIAAPANAGRVAPRAGEGWISLVARTCGSSSNWQTVARSNGASAPHWWLPSRSVSVTCPGRTTGKASRSNPRPSTGWQLPLNRFSLTSCYGYRWGSLHRGLDMAAPYGTPIHAMAAGTVTRAGWLWGGYGISVVINHGGVWTHIAHMSREIVSPGQRVVKGQTIGYVGSTGNSTGNHSHVEVATRSSVLGYQVNPAPWLRARGVKVGC